MQEQDETILDETAPDGGGQGPSDRRTIFWGVLVLLILAAIVWLNFPIFDQLVRGRYTETPTPLPPTPTRRPTKTPTLEPTPTLPPPPSPTPYPASAYVLEDLAKLDPPLPQVTRPPVVMGVGKGLTADPPFESPRWISSKTIAEQLKAEITEPYYATFGRGGAQWSMDVALQPGYYELFVLDTVYSSSGSLDFKVYLGGSEITPVNGVEQQHVDYRSSRGEGAAYFDLWHSLGIYHLERADLLTVQTTWMDRDENTIVAVGRLLVAHLPDSTADLLGRLPQGRLTYVMDNLAAKVEGDQLVIALEDTLAWGDGLQSIVNPNNDMKVTWALQDPAPVGKYEIFLWIPAEHNTGEGVLHVFANGSELPGGPLLVRQKDFQGGQWVSTGIWDVSHPIYGKTVNLSVRLDVAGGTVGDTALDAVAFSKVQ